MIVPIPKNTDTSKMENFRDITLLSVVGKDVCEYSQSPAHKVAEGAEEWILAFLDIK